MSPRDSLSGSSNGGPGIGRPPHVENGGGLTDGSLPDAQPDFEGRALADADAAAMDALVEAGWNPEAVSAELRPRSRRVMDLLAPVAACALSSHEESLEDIVLLRVARMRASAGAAVSATPTAHELSEADARAVDALVAAGMNPAAAENAEPPRVQRQIAFFSLLNEGPDVSHGREDRIARTLATVQASIDADQDRLRMGATSGGGRRGIQFADLVSVAALLLIGAAVVWPILENAREYGRRTACQTGMLTAGLGLGQYAASNRDMLPMATESRAGNPWWEVGGAPERSNSANLFTLVRTGHVGVADLACAGNRNACRDSAQAGEMDWRRFPQVSYSYRMMFGRRAPQVTDRPEAIILADRSTLILLGPGRLEVRPFENSPNHGGRGQSVLRADRSVAWLTSPILGDGDNLWLPRPIEQVVAKLQGGAVAERLQGVEIPQGATDEFVAP